MSIGDIDLGNLTTYVCIHETHKNDGIEMREETHSEMLKTVRKMKSGNAPDLSTMNRTRAKQAKKGFADWLKDMTYDPIIPNYICIK